MDDDQWAQRVNEYNDRPYCLVGALMQQLDAPIARAPYTRRQKLRIMVVSLRERMALKLAPWLADE